MSDSFHRGFATTQWSLVKAAGTSQADQQQALADLCERYWYPLYAFLRRSLERADAEDVLQSFFVHVLETDLLHSADPAAGRFRSYLLTSLQNHLANWRRAARAQRRGGGRWCFSLDVESAEARFQQEDLAQLTAEQVYERQWAWTLIDRAVRRLEEEWTEKGKQPLFQALRPMLVGQGDGESYRAVATRLGLSESAVKVTAFRLRQQCGERIREEIAATLADPDDLEEEIQNLFRVLGAPH